MKFWAWANKPQPVAKRIVIGIALAIFLLGWSRTIRSRPDLPGDFPNHVEFGRYLLSDKPLYSYGVDTPYPPFWAFAHAAFTFMSNHVALIVMYPTFIVALLGLLTILDRLTREHLPVSRETKFWIAVLAIVASFRFVHRDTEEVGANLVLVAFTWLGIFAWTRRRDWLGGWSLGLAVALKCTAGLFIAYFLYKRQWKMAFTSTLAAILFSLSPIFVLGPREYASTMQTWIHTVLGEARSTNPMQNLLGDVTVDNFSLRPAIARYLMQLPPGHKSRFDSPLYVDFLNLSPHATNTVIRIVTVAILLIVGWCFRRRVVARNDLSIIWECAAVSVLLLILSPLTWGHHCVGVLPAAYLFVRTIATGGRIPWWMFWPLGIYLFLVTALNRGLIGKSLSQIVDSYHAVTLALLLLLWATLAMTRKPQAAIKIDDSAPIAATPRVVRPGS